MPKGDKTGPPKSSTGPKDGEVMAKEIIPIKAMVLVNKLVVVKESAEGKLL